MAGEERTVLVAMSGGVDSSVAAALLKQQGYQPIGVMLRLWSPHGESAYNRCCSPHSMNLARKVASILDIPFYVLDVQTKFHQIVVHEAFTQGYLSGLTPNPCLTCNRHIRWGFLFQYKQVLGAQWFATGHYARIDRDANGSPILKKAFDETKDQSYVLHVLNQELLQWTLFPIGHLRKEEVRTIAASLGLPVAQRKDSQDLCFLGNQDYRQFLTANVSEEIKPGAIISTDGKILGVHQGLPFYTIGQRKGLNIPSSRPFYVIRKDVQNNILIVGERCALDRHELLIENMNWISSKTPQNPFYAHIKIRYTSPAYPGEAIPLPDGRVRVKFEQPVSAVTPGQAAVLYQGDVCLGGGTIGANEEV